MIQHEPLPDCLVTSLPADKVRSSNAGLTIRHLYTSGSDAYPDVCRRQILTYKDDPHTEIIIIFIIAIKL